MGRSKVRYPKNSLLTLILLTWPILGSSQTLALKTNLLYDALLIPSLGAEYAVGNKATVNLFATFNPFSYGDRKWKNWSLQPEYRFWSHCAFTGFFFGVNAVVGGYNINKVRVGNLHDHQHQGTMVGGGLSAGYHLIISTRFSMEFVAAADFVHCAYDRMDEGVKTERHHSGLILPLGTGINIVYILQ